ncbi:MAG: hypothetical protein JWM45_2176 [Pseudonocardiales bacterium]|nr:hypothetical protein [Pseudonocardiales bacterium]
MGGNGGGESRAVTSGSLDRSALRAAVARVRNSSTSMLTKARFNDTAPPVLINGSSPAGRGCNTSRSAESSTDSRLLVATRAGRPGPERGISDVWLAR